MRVLIFVFLFIPFFASAQEQIEYKSNEEFFKKFELERNKQPIRYTYGVEPEPHGYVPTPTFTNEVEEFDEVNMLIFPRYVEPTPTFQENLRKYLRVALNPRAVQPLEL